MLSMKKKGIAKLLLLAICMLQAVVLCSCSSDDHHDKEDDLHVTLGCELNGLLNNVPVYEKWTDASDTSYQVAFEGDDIPSMKLRVVLSAQQDSVVVLHLTMKDLSRSNVLIYSPNDGGQVHTEDSCYLEVKNLHTGGVTRYCPKDAHPISVRWLNITYSETTTENDATPHNTTVDFRRGIQASLEGVFFNAALHRQVPVSLAFSVL
jgi:hypothetical protein